MKLASFRNEGLIEAGCDEAGRGCLAGPVTAAAVILPKSFNNPVLNDSKQLSLAERESLRTLIEKESIAWAVAFVPPKKIDEINILNASFLAMHKALKKLDAPFNHILVDGNRFKAYKNVSFECIIKGDGKYASIAAASVLAKTYRDDYMKELHRKFPEFSWETNVGYPTLAHREAIRNHGSNQHHRKSFRLLPYPEQLELF